MIVHSRDDTVVRYPHSQVLLTAAGENAQHLAASGPHISAFRDVEIRKAVLSWLEKTPEN